MEKYRVNKEGCSEMMSLSSLTPARDGCRSVSIPPHTHPRPGYRALGMAFAVRSRFDGEELVVIYQISAKDKARRGGGEPGSAGIYIGNVS